MRSLSAILLWLLAIVTLAAQPASSTVADSPALPQFQANVAHYLDATKGVREKIKPSSSIHHIHQQRLQLAEGIRSVRAGAKRGEIFTPPVAAMFTQTLASIDAGPHGQRIRTSMRHAEPVDGMALTIDGRYPDNVPLQSTPPTLLAKLPPLPTGVEYRIVGRTLVLRDRDADTVIDYLPSALPSSAGKAR